MIYSNFYWHLKEVYDLFPVQYKVRSISFFGVSAKSRGELETFGRCTSFIFGALCFIDLYLGRWKLLNNYVLKTEQRPSS